MSRYADNILAAYDVATTSEIANGMTWYQRANAFAWTINGTDVVRAAGVIAALSPKLRWELNMVYAREAFNLKGYPFDAALNYIPAMGLSRTRALAIVNGEWPLNVLGGQKVLSFFHNILHPNDDDGVVTVDTHAMHVAQGFTEGYETTKRMTPRVYNEIAQGYVIAARQVGILPQQMQAITWQVQKAEKWGK